MRSSSSPRELGRTIDISSLGASLKSFVVTCSPLPFIFAVVDPILEPRQCTLFPDTYGYLLQVVLGFMCFGMLVAKKVIEDCFVYQYQRSWTVFMLDVSKEGTASMLIHCLNLAAATALGSFYNVDECDWYFLNIFVDSTVGSYLTYKLLRWTESHMGYRSGLYHKSESAVLKPDYRIEEAEAAGGSSIDDAGLLSVLVPSPSGIDFVELKRQMIVWIACVTICKLLVLGVLLPTVGLWESGVAWFFALFAMNYKTKLFVVMVVAPFLMNAFWLIVTDQYIKFRPDYTSIDSNFEHIRGKSMNRVLS